MTAIEIQRCLMGRTDYYVNVNTKARIQPQIAIFKHNSSES